MNARVPKPKQSGDALAADVASIWDLACSIAAAGA